MTTAGSGRGGRATLLCLAGGSVALAVLAVSAGQLDDFQDGTTMGWQHGTESPLPPTVVPDGGPLGAGDAYLAVASLGGLGPGSRLAVLNRAQWTGDFGAEGLGAITAHFANLDTAATPELSMRLGIDDGLSQCVTDPALSLTASAWTELTFDLDSLVLLSGPGPCDDTLLDVFETRFLSAAATTYAGDPIVALLGIDNVRSDRLVFIDGFESGDTSRWSAFVP